MDMAALAPVLSDADQDAHEPEAPPSAKARRGRKPKADAITTESPDSADAAMSVEPESPAPEPMAPEPSEPELPAREAKAPKPPSSPRKTRRNREPEASAPPPLDIADEAPVESPAPAAAQWHAETGTVTFDWPAIEQAAASEGPNQPMAKLLLAARTEGATSRWPF